jgi:hypothetical protein
VDAVITLDAVLKSFERQNGQNVGGATSGFQSSLG